MKPAARLKNYLPLHIYLDSKDLQYLVLTQYTEKASENKYTYFEWKEAKQAASQTAAKVLSWHKLVCPG